MHGISLTDRLPGTTMVPFPRGLPRRVEPTSLPAHRHPVEPTSPLARHLPVELTSPLARRHPVELTSPLARRLPVEPTSPLVRRLPVEQTSIRFFAQGVGNKDFPLREMPVSVRR